MDLNILSEYGIDNLITQEEIDNIINFIIECYDKDNDTKPNEEYISYLKPYKIFNDYTKEFKKISETLEKKAIALLKKEEEEKEKEEARLKNPEYVDFEADPSDLLFSTDILYDRFFEESFSEESKTETPIESTVNQLFNNIFEEFRQIACFKISDRKNHRIKKGTKIDLNKYKHIECGDQIEFLAEGGWGVADKNGIYIPPMMMAIDSTSISTYSQSIENAAFGHAKQDDFLKQVNLTLCVDYETGDVCYAYESEGSINDMTIFPDILMRMQNLGLDLSEVLITTDRGYSSVMNVQKQINCKLRFLTGVKLTEDSIKAKINRYKDSLNNPLFMKGTLAVYARTGEIEKWSSTVDGITVDHDVYLHLYHDGALGERQTIAFMCEVQRLLDIKNNNLKMDNNLWRNYSRFIEQDKQSKVWHLNADAVQKACRYNGYFAIRTNEVSDPFDSLVIYRERNIVETAFKQFKVLNDGERLNATGSSYKGKIFIHLLAQTLRMMLSVSAAAHKAEGKVLPGESLEKAMLQLKKLQATKPAGRGIYITKEIPKKTRDLFELFCVPFPKKQIKN